VSHPKQPVDLRESVRALARTRLSKIRPDAAPRFLDENFPAQSAFITDPGRMKVVLCTRRSGKSSISTKRPTSRQAFHACIWP